MLAELQHQTASRIWYGQYAHRCYWHFELETAFFFVCGWCWLVCVLWIKASDWWLWWVGLHSSLLISVMCTVLIICRGWVCAMGEEKTANVIGMYQIKTHFVWFVDGDNIWCSMHTAWWWWWNCKVCPCYVCMLRTRKQISVDKRRNTIKRPCKTECQLNSQAGRKATKRYGLCRMFGHRHVCHFFFFFCFQWKYVHMIGDTHWPPIFFFAGAVLVSHNPFEILKYKRTSLMTCPIKQDIITIQLNACFVCTLRQTDRPTDRHRHMQTDKDHKHTHNHWYYWTNIENWHTRQTSIRSVWIGLVLQNKHTWYEPTSVLPYTITKTDYGTTKYSHLTIRPF